MSNIVAFDPTQLPAVLRDSFSDSVAQELGGGIQAAFPVVSYRGRVWRIKAKGEEHIIRDEVSGDPRGSIEVVLLAANEHLSKIFYDKTYQEGDDNPPRCWSIDGVRPDAQVENPICPTCAACPNNVWGSKITPQGTKVKACTDSKRVACVPAADIENKTLGGPMLLRIPAASLQGLLQYSATLSGQGIPYYAVVTRLSFDVDASYPKLQCQTMSLVTDPTDAAKVLELRNSPEVQRILASMDDAIAGEPEPLVVHEAPAVVPEAPAPQQTGNAEYTPEVVTLPETPPAVTAAVTDGPVTITMPADPQPGAIVDSTGTKFDPDLHATGKEGAPSYNKDGSFRKRRGTGAAAAPAAAPAEPSPPAAAAPAGNGAGAADTTPEMDSFISNILGPTEG